MHTTNFSSIVLWVMAGHAPRLTSYDAVSKQQSVGVGWESAGVALRQVDPILSLTNCPGGVHNLSPRKGYSPTKPKIMYPGPRKTPYTKNDLSQPSVGHVNQVHARQRLGLKATALAESEARHWQEECCAKTKKCVKEWRGERGV